MNNDVLAALRRLTAECMDEAGALLRPSLEAVQQAQAALARGMEARSGETEGLDPEGATARSATPTRPEGNGAGAEAVEALRLGLELSKYAAAPFFGEKQCRRDDGGEVFYVWATTEEWWEGLRELIEQAQPKLSAALSPKEQS